MSESDINLILTRLAVIETKIDQLVERDRDTEARLRSLERWRYLATGAAAAVGSASGALVSLLLA